MTPRKSRRLSITVLILLGAFLAVVAAVRGLTGLTGLGGDPLNAIQASSGLGQAGSSAASAGAHSALAGSSTASAGAHSAQAQGQILSSQTQAQPQGQAPSGQAQSRAEASLAQPQAQVPSGQTQARPQVEESSTQPQVQAPSGQTQVLAQTEASSAQPQLQVQPEIAPPRGFTKVAENEYLSLCLNEETTEIAVIDRRYGQVWFSNPVNRATNEKIARGAAKNRLSSQLTIVYYTPTQARKELDSYNDSVLYGQFEILPLENGVRIDYIIGKQWDEASFLPVLVSAERLQQIVDSIERDRDKKLFYDNYLPLSLEPVGPDYERVEISEVDSRSFLGDYALRSPGESLTTAKERELLPHSSIPSSRTGAMLNGGACCRHRTCRSCLNL